MKSIMIAVACIGVLFLAGCRNSNDHEVFTRVYNGTLETTHSGQTNVYSVEISECQRRQGEEVFRIVHLYPIINGEVSRLSSITGHDWNSSGNWSRIFYCGYRTSDGTNSFQTGCNSVAREESGNWSFEPCPSDEDRVKPFSNEQILFAIQELDEAMLQIRSPKHLSYVNLWNQKERRCVQVKAVTASAVSW